MAGIGMICKTANIVSSAFLGFTVMHNLNAIARNLPATPIPVNIHECHRPSLGVADYQRLRLCSVCDSQNVDMALTWNKRKRPD